MELFTDIDYLKIDIANNSGKSEYHLDDSGKPKTLDKLQYQERIEWFNTKFNNTSWFKTATVKELKEFILSSLIEPETALVFAGLLAYQDYLNDKPSGYRISLDAVASGTQIMSALTACENGLLHTGALGNKRGDVYTAVYEEYTKLIGSTHVKTRAEIKEAVMVKAYGSRKRPLQLVGEAGIPYFNQAMQNVCNGAYQLGEILTSTWNSNQSYHAWINADGHTSYIPVTVDTPYTFTVLGMDIPIKIKEQQATQNGLSNAANAIHAVDGMLVREMVRRCNYEPTKIINIIHWLNQANTVNQDTGSVDVEQLRRMGQLGKLIHLFNETNFLTVRICDYIYSITDVLQMSFHHRNQLLKVLSKMIQYNPFNIVVVHQWWT